MSIGKADMGLRLTDLHYRRHSAEMRNLEPALAPYWAAKDMDYSEQNRLGYEKYHDLVLNPAQDIAQAAFPADAGEEAIWEAILREEELRRSLRGWEASGASIFTFAQPLLEMLARTDVGQLPVQSLRLPYPSLYVSLPPGAFLPDFHPRFEIDGFYMHSDTDLPQKLKDAVRDDADIVAEVRRLWANNPEQVALNYRERGLPDTPEADLEARLKWNAGDRRRYERYLADPDAYMDAEARRAFGEDDDPDTNGDHYWMLSGDFTFRPKGLMAQPLSAAELLDMPTLRFCYDFPSHRFTVDEAISYGMSDGIPLHTFYETDFCADPRNVVSDPAVLDDVTRLVFNVVCYMNWPERDQQKRLSDPRAQSRIDRLSGAKPRREAEARALKDGARWIQFCGYRTERERTSPVGTGGGVGAHWRRGHWRNQRFGKGLADTKLLWIKPTMVGGEVAIAPPTVYEVAQAAK